MTFVQLVLGLVKPILSRVLVALGLSVVTIVGVDVALTQAKGWITANVGGMSGAMAGLAGLAGLGDALGYVFGAMTFASTLWAIRSATAIYGKGQG